MPTWRPMAALEVPVLAVHRHEGGGANDVVERAQLVLGGVAGDVHIGVAPVMDDDAMPDEVVDDP